MFLQNIWLRNFKNYTEAQLSFETPLTCILGPNGSGKTNLLDAIHYLCFCKSYFNPVDSQNVKHNEDFFSLKGTFRKNEESHQVFCNVVKRKKKTVRRNGKEYQRLSDHIGRFPVVMIAPGDLVLITGGSKERRKFVDTILGQYDKQYLKSLMQYKKLIKQRNRQLKDFAKKGYFDRDLIASLDKQIVPRGQEVYETRQSFWKDFMPRFQQYYRRLSQNKESVDGQYRSPLQQDDFEALLDQQAEKDRHYQRTTKGVHKDDFKFLIEGYPLKKYGSQGQQKSFLYALKLTQYDLLKERTGASPLLLLDDIFDRLDHERVQRLLQIVLKAGIGQVFLTDTQAQRIGELLEPYSVDFEKRFIKHGEIL